MARRLPPGNRVPRNTAGDPYYEIEEINFGSWGPLPDGKGPSTQVHMAITVKGFPAPLVMRFKGPGTLDLVIEALRRHRFDVWPGK